MLEQRFCIIIKMWILLSNTKFRVFRYRLPKKSVLSRKKIPPFFSRFFRLSCHLWTQFSQLLKGQFVKFLCLSHREFPEVFKTPPTFISSPFQSGVIAQKPRKSVFFGTPCILVKTIKSTSSEFKHIYKQRKEPKNCKCCSASLPVRLSPLYSETLHKGSLKLPKVFLDSGRV